MPCSVQVIIYSQVAEFANLWCYNDANLTSGGHRHVCIPPHDTLFEGWRMCLPSTRELLTPIELIITQAAAFTAASVKSPRRKKLCEKSHRPCRKKNVWQQWAFSGSNEAATWHAIWVVCFLRVCAVFEFLKKKKWKKSWDDGSSSWCECRHKLFAAGECLTGNLGCWRAENNDICNIHWHPHGGRIETHMCLLVAVVMTSLSRRSHAASACIKTQTWIIKSSFVRPTKYFPALVKDKSLLSLTRQGLFFSANTCTAQDLIALSST